MSKLIRRIIVIMPALIAQLLWLFVALNWLAPYATAISLLLSFLAVIYVIYIITNRNESTYKMLWLLVILGLPVFGTIFYLLIGNKRTARPLQKKIEQGRPLLPEIETNGYVQKEISRKNTRFSQTLRYVEKKTGFHTHPCDEACYYPLGEEMYQQMLVDLESAEKFIFVEYFIIERGKMWDSMVEIMERKVLEGVDVRIMYDDLGSISTYSLKNMYHLKKKGMKCIRFNSVLFIKGTLNYRDHRKMLIVDGRVAFSGGVNLADEYINEKEKYGHWKDIGFRITGAPVQNYTKMFAEFWDAFSKEPIPAEELEHLCSTTSSNQEKGYILSYYDSPIRTDATSNTLYIELLSQATRYAWFYTPYLMLGDSLMDAFVRAAQRGVDVRIIMPGIPDKALVYRMSRSFYIQLLQAGVKIYEYTPGFVHAKGCIIDDEIGTMGTVNLDYRSLFLHFENNSLFYQVALLQDLKKDFLETQSKCMERTTDNIRMNFMKWLLDGILRILAPLC